MKTVRIVAAHKRSPWMTALQAVALSVQQGVSMDFVVLYDDGVATDQDREVYSRLVSRNMIRLEHYAVEGMLDWLSNHGLMLDGHFILGNNSWKSFDAVLILDSDCFPLTTTSVKQLVDVAVDQGTCSAHHHISCACFRPDALTAGLTRAMSFIPFDRKQRYGNPPANPTDKDGYFDTGTVVMAWAGAGPTGPNIPGVFAHAGLGTRMPDGYLLYDSKEPVVDALMRDMFACYDALDLKSKMEELGVPMPTRSQVEGEEPYVLGEPRPRKPPIGPQQSWWRVT